MLQGQESKIHTSGDESRIKSCSEVLLHLQASVKSTGFFSKAAIF